MQSCTPKNGFLHVEVIEGTETGRGISLSKGNQTLKLARVISSSNPVMANGEAVRAPADPEDTVIFHSSALQEDVVNGEKYQFVGYGGIVAVINK